MKIQPKEEIPQEPPKDVEVDNKLELLKYTSEVQSRIRKDISSDFILAKLDEKDKEGVIEMTSNAYFCKKIGNIIKQQARKRGKWEWKKNHYERVPHTNNYLEELKILSESTFDAFMIRIYMTVILNRNVPKNHILKILAGQHEQEQQIEDEQPPIKLKEKLKKVIKGEQQEEVA